MHAVPIYSAKIQCAKEAVSTPPLGKLEKTSAQQVVGVFLLYKQVIDGTILCPLSVIVMDQVNPTQEIMKKVGKFLNHTGTHPDAILVYRKNNMILTTYSDVL